MRWHSHLSRFFFGFSHAERPLTDAQRTAYDRRVRELANSDRWGYVTSILPGIGAVAAIPIWIRLQQHVSFPMQLAAQVAFGVSVFVYALYLIRWKHMRHGSRALRELGLADVCARCAYDLSRQPAAEGICPECGVAFTRFHPARSDSRDQP